MPAQGILFRFAATSFLLLARNILKIHADNGTCLINLNFTKLPGLPSRKISGRDYANCRRGTVKTAQIVCTFLDLNNPQYQLKKRGLKESREQKNNLF